MIHEVGSPSVPIPAYLGQSILCALSYLISCKMFTFIIIFWVLESLMALEITFLLYLPFIWVPLTFLQIQSFEMKLQSSEIQDLLPRIHSNRKERFTEQCFQTDSGLNVKPVIRLAFLLTFAIMESRHPEYQWSSYHRSCNTRSCLVSWASVWDELHLSGRIGDFGLTVI